MKKKNKDIKNKIFKISAIISFIINGLIGVILLIGLCMPKVEKTSAMENSNPNYTDIALNELRPIESDTIFYSFNRCSLVYTPGNRFTIYFRGSFKFTQNYSTYSSDYVSFSFYGGSNPTHLMCDFWSSRGTLTFDLNSMGGESLSTFKFYFISLTTIEQPELFCNYFYRYVSSYDPSNSQFYQQRFLKPFVNLNSFYQGVTYPFRINTNLTGVNQNNETLVSTLYIDYDNKVYLGYNDYSSVQIGTRELNNEGVYYLSPITILSSTSINVIFDNFYNILSLNNNFINDFLSNNSTITTTDLNGCKYVSFSGTYIFSFYRFIYFINDFSGSNFSNHYIFNCDFLVPNFNNMRFTSIDLYVSVNGSVRTFAITFINSIGRFTIFEGSIYDSVDNLYKGVNYNFQLTNPYLFNVIFEDSYISESAFKNLYILIAPTNINIDFVVNTNGLGGAFDIVGNTLSSAFNVFEVEVFPGVSLWVFILVPLFLLITIAILKVIKG